MISEMLRTSRWFYVQEPVWPPGPRRRNSWYRKRALYSEIIGVVKGSPGISTGDVARKLGRPYAYISPLLFHLKRFESLRYEPAGVERTGGLASFAEVPCVRQMLSKLGSEKTKGPWLRRLFRYQEWLRGKAYFGSVAELLEDCRRAGTEGKYRHVDLMQEYLNSFRGSVYYKDSIATIIRGFYRKNRAELPKEKITYDRGMLIMAPSSTEEYIRPGRVQAGQWLKSMGIPHFAADLVTVLEFLGGVFLILGLLTPLVGLFFVVQFGSIIWMKKSKMHASFISTEQGKPTYEIDVVYLLLALVFLVLGAGSFSLDSLLGL